MAKSQPTPAPSPWLALMLSGLTGLLLGATGMYFLLLPKLTRPALLPQPPLMAAPHDPASHLPPPGLTAGMNPALAARTLGNFYYDHQNWPQAISQYESAIQQGSDDADIRTDLGNAYRFSGRPDDALAQYTAAQRMNPAHEFSLFNQGGLYLEELHQPAKAIALWQEYLVRFPQGRNVSAAQQLIAQAQNSSGRALGNAPAPAAAAPARADEERLLRLMQPAASKP